jgi:hypothetical protein
VACRVIAALFGPRDAGGWGADRRAAAHGVETEFGDTPPDNLAFAVRTIRDHLRGAGREHHGARLFCPDCGQRMSQAG